MRTGCNDVPRALALCAAFAAVAAGAGSAGPPTAPDSPLALAAALERTIVSGEGAVLPDPDIAVVLKAGSFDLSAGTWPAEFRSRAGETVSVSVSPETGCYEFSDSSGETFYTVVPVVPTTENWVAPVRRAGDAPAPADPLFHPSRVAMLWRILGPDTPNIHGNPESPESLHGSSSSLSASSPSAASSPSVASSPSAAPALGPAPAAATNLHFSAISLSSGTNAISFCADWPADSPPPDSILDLYETDALDAPRWRRVASFPATNPPPAQFTLPWPALGDAPPRHVHDSSCTATTNVVVSPLDGVTPYTNVVWSCAGALRRGPTPGAFFRLGTRLDTDSDGLPDAFEKLCLGTDPHSADTDGDTMPDGWEASHGLDPLYALDAIEDADNDGIPNVYEYHRGTDVQASDREAFPKIVAGGSGTNGVVDLKTALAQAEAYTLVEVSPGVHSGTGWTGLWMPRHPVMVAGVGRTAVIRHADSGMAAFYLDEEQTTHTVFADIDVELAGSSGFQTAFWLGNGDLFRGPGAAAFFRNVHVRLGESPTDRLGWFCRHSTSNPVVLANCTVDAAGSTRARGVYAVDSPELVLENCTFLGFPPAASAPSYGIQTESTAANIGGAADPVPVTLVNCLFDESFRDARPYAPLTNGVAYAVSMESCMVPAPLVYLPRDFSGSFVAGPEVTADGHLLTGAAAIGRGSPVRFSSFDFDGEPRDGAPDIGADEWSDDPATDSDGDGLPNAIEIFETGTDPFREDTDRDGVPDADEVAEGTDPADPSNVCFRLAGTLSAPKLAGTNGVWLVLLAVSPDSADEVAAVRPGPPPSFAFAFPHVEVSGAASLAARLFVDSDGDGVFGSDESGQTVPVTISGHDTAASFSFPDVTDDADSDGIPDNWETAHGLCPTNSLDALEDPDGDGLVNLHEYWHGFDPHADDGGGTVLSILSRSIDGRLAGKNPEKALPVYSNYVANAKSGIFVPNPDCWAAGLDFSCASPWNSGDIGNWRAGTLISPRHILYAEHFKVPPLVDVLFVAPDGSVSRSRHVARKRVGDSDICIGLLDPPVTNSLAIAKFLPSDSFRHLGLLKGIPSMGLDQEEKALVFDLDRRFFAGTNRISTIAFGKSRNPVRRDFYELPVKHDSGNPLFLFFGSAPVLVGTLHTDWAVDDCSAFLDAIQETMDDLSPGDTLEILDFTGYPECSALIRQ